MWEVTIIDNGIDCEMGTFDYAKAPAIGNVYEDDMKIISIEEINPEVMTATVRIEFV